MVQALLGDESGARTALGVAREADSGYEKLDWAERRVADAIG